MVHRTPHAVILLMISKSQNISLDIKLHQTLNQRKQRKKDCEFLFIDYFINLPSHLYLKSLTNPSLMVCVHNFINSTCMPMRTFKEYIFYPRKRKKISSPFRLWSKFLQALFPPVFREFFSYDKML